MIYTEKIGIDYEKKAYIQKVVIKKIKKAIHFNSEKFYAQKEY